MTYEYGIFFPLKYVMGAIRYRLREGACLCGGVMGHGALSSVMRRGSGSRQSLSGRTYDMAGFVATGWAIPLDVRCWQRTAAQWKRGCCR